VPRLPTPLNQERVTFLTTKKVRLKSTMEIQNHTVQLIDYAHYFIVKRQNVLCLSANPDIMLSLACPCHWPFSDEFKSYLCKPIKALSHDQIIFDNFHVSNVFLTVYITNFRQIYFGKCMCSKTGWLNLVVETTGL
jgi:hypothetical protein